LFIAEIRRPYYISVIVIGDSKDLNSDSFFLPHSLGSRAAFPRKIYDSKPTFT
jgi:hypothetical protein